MVQMFDAATIVDDGYVGDPRPAQVYTAETIADEGYVGQPMLFRAWGPMATTPFPTGAPTVSTVLPEVAIQIVDFDHAHVGWLPLMKQGAAARGSVSSPGSIVTTLDRDDPALADIDFEDRILRYWLRGELIAAAIVNDREDATVDEREEVGEEAGLGGLGTLSIFEDVAVPPWKLNWYPDMRTMRFNYAHPDFDDSTWHTAHVKATQGIPSARWTGDPYGWPDPDAQWIGGPYGSQYDAPTGDTYIRRAFGPLDGRKYAAFWTADNLCTLFLDGVEIGVTQDWRQLQRVNLELSDGYHVLAAKVTNYPKLALTNPTGFIFSLYAVSDQGRLGDIVMHTNVGFGDWKAIQNPAKVPGWTYGKVLNWLLDRWYLDGGQYITRTWTDTRDSNGVAWETYEEITVQVGQSGAETINQFCEAYLDVEMAPGSWTMHAWNKGGRGRDLALTIESAEDADVDEACITSLVHRSSPPVATDLLVRWEKNWFQRTRTRLPGARQRMKHLQLPTVSKQATAEDIADQILEVYGRERVEYTFGIQPRIDSQVVGIAIRAGDRLAALSRDETYEDVRVNAWSVVCNIDGEVSYQFEAGDRISYRQESVTAWLKRLSDGALNGQTHQALPDQRGSYAYSAATVVPRLHTFDRDASVTATTSKPDPITTAGIIIEVTVEIPTEDSGVFDVLVNSSIVATVTCTGDASTSLLGIAVPVDRDDKLTIYSTTTGFGCVVKVTISG